MKKNELTKLKEKSIKELRKQVSELKKKHIDATVKSVSGKESNPKLAHNLRGDISQIATIIREKELDERRFEEKD